MKCTMAYEMSLHLFYFLQNTIDQDGGQGGSGVLTYIPSTLTRWTEEAKVLDGDSVHDCVTGMSALSFSAKNKCHKRS